MLLFNKYKIIIILFVFLIFHFIYINKICASEIILDPGHSPNSFGAISCTGEKEYLYNDKLVNYIKNNLDKNNINSTITRMSSQNMSLLERVKSTKSSKLFISIHHDSVQPQFIKHINKYPTSDKANGYSIFISRKNKFFDKSLEYAIDLAKNLRNKGLIPSTHHGEKIKGENREVLDKELGIYIFDDLIVLKKSQCPAILLEAGVIVNPNDEKKVKTENFKLNVSKAIVETIKSIKTISARFISKT